MGARVGNKTVAKTTSPVVVFLEREISCVVEENGLGMKLRGRSLPGDI